MLDLTRDTQSRIFVIEMKNTLLKISNEDDV